MPLVQIACKVRAKPRELIWINIHALHSGALHRRKIAAREKRNGIGIVEIVVSAKVNNLPK